MQIKKWIGTVFAVLLCMALCLPTAFAETVYTEGYFYYTIKDESITIAGYFGSETEVTVPSSIAGVPVNTIASGAFTDTTVKKLHLPDTIMKVEEGAAGTAQVYYAGSEKPVNGGGDSSQKDDSSGKKKDTSKKKDQSKKKDSASKSSSSGTAAASGSAAAEGSVEEDSSQQHTEVGVNAGSLLPDLEQAESNASDASASQTQESAAGENAQGGGAGAVIAVLVIGAAAGAFFYARRKKSQS